MEDDRGRVCLDADDRATLLAIARRGVKAAAGGQRPGSGTEGPKREGEPLDSVHPVFVTLRSGSRLRGCIGTLETRDPLRRAVLECAMSSARHDPRFPPVAEEEVDGITIEISVLTPFRRIGGPEEIVIGEHGLYLRRGPHSGLLLPQVAVEYGWGAVEFLEQCCGKAGLSAGSWEEAESEIMIFSALVFGEDPDA